MYQKIAKPYARCDSDCWTEARSGGRSDGRWGGRTVPSRADLRSLKAKPFRNVGDGKKLCYRHEIGPDHVAAMNQAELVSVASVACPGDAEMALVPIVVGAEVVHATHRCQATALSYPCNDS